MNPVRVVVAKSLSAVAVDSSSYNAAIAVSKGVDMSDDGLNDIREHLDTLRLEHRDLDDVIAHLTEDPFYDQLQLKRLKTRKLKLKDMISKLESMLIPDMPA